MKRHVIITAGGTGVRMGSSIPKQFLELDGRPVLIHTIERFYKFDPSINIILVLAKDWHKQWKDLCIKHNFTIQHRLVEGGGERFYSVKNGLRECAPASLVAIHDAVRPLVSQSTIKSCFEKAASTGNAIPVIPVNESLRQTEADDGKSRPLDRDRVRVVQTPQVFRSDLLHKAYDCGFSPSFTDDATVVEQLGITINMVEGNRENIKITTPHDLLMAGAIIKDIKQT